jgi:co-chaperonin GroES (HSP10)
MIKYNDFKLAEGYVLVKEKEQEKILSSGIIIPDTVKRKVSNIGSVVKTACGIIEGTVIIFRKSKGVPIELDGYPYYIVEEEHVEATCE